MGHYDGAIGRYLYICTRSHQKLEIYGFNNILTSAYWIKLLKFAMLVEDFKIKRSIKFEQKLTVVFSILFGGNSEDQLEL